MSSSNSRNWRWVASGLGALLLAFSLAAPAAACPRIVSQSPYITRALEWFGLGQCIVGVSRYDERELPRTGGVLDPDADAIAVLDPQLMITSNWTPADVWQTAAPAGATALRVDGFRSMADAEAMLRAIGQAAGVSDADARVDGFARDWRAAAATVVGRGRRLLIVSACSGIPYSYGRNTTLFDLFESAGFHVVENREGIRQLQAGEPVETLAALVAATRAEAVVALVSSRTPSCSAQLAAAGVPIIAFADDSFIHPGAGLIDALRQLRERMHD